jgi:glycerol-3-phosphate dehydrogenase
LESLAQVGTGGQPIHPRLPILEAQITYAARWEMARTVEDALSRRTRALLLDARAAQECSPKVAEILVRELPRSESWKKQQIAEFQALADRYLL